MLGIGSRGARLHKATKAVTFDGGAGSGAVGSVNYFTVTGEVLVCFMVPFCTGSLTEAGASALMTLGVTGSTALFVASTGAVNIDVNMFWIDATPDANGVALDAKLKDIVITDNIIVTVAGQNVNGGTLRIDCYWYPLSSDGLVVPA